VVDDTLCHKRGVKVAFGGIFLDAVLSSKKHKTLRFGLNWVVLGPRRAIPMRPDPSFCLRCSGGSTARRAGRIPDPPQAAAKLARTLARPIPTGRSGWLATALTSRGGVAGPTQEPPGDRALALERRALYHLPGPRRPDQKGASRKKGVASRTPRR